ncbi:C40 family peptidase [Acidithrix ferrooxidans]|uniref:Putative endopeptidase p60 n=1 Tax=Acidithrix ferrooxidans TaxID=1280514 RepID=A0A0D8HIK1_9ACTN|nr:C40 family peptidase [Acidithrix ferrooxidans]KJF17689.1 putative endopeptidase p60 precursor [Acidithrix ferrooxidans]
MTNLPNNDTDLDAEFKVTEVRSKKFSRKALTGISALVLGLTPIATFATSASADQLSSAKAQASAIASKIATLNAQVSAYSEAYDQAQLKLQTLNQQISISKASIASTEAKIAELRKKLAAEAVNFYTQGGSVVSFADVLNGSSTDVTLRDVFAGTVANSQQTLIAQFNLANANLNIEKAKLASEKALATAALNSAASSKAAAQSAMNTAQSQLLTVNSNIASLVLQAQKQQQLAQEAAALQAQKRAQALALAQHLQLQQQQLQQQQLQQQQLQQQRSATTTSRANAQQSNPNGQSAYVAIPPGAGAGTAVSVAMAQIGKSYVFGGAGPNYFDCSGFVMYAWAHAGVYLPHSAAAQYDSIQHVSLNSLQPGDLVFYFTPIDHVAMYIGNGEVVVADNPSYPIMVRSLYWDGSPVGAGRP